MSMSPLWLAASGSHRRWVWEPWICCLGGRLWCPRAHICEARPTAVGVRRRHSERDDSCSTSSGGTCAAGRRPSAGFFPSLSPCTAAALAAGGVVGSARWHCGGAGYYLLQWRAPPPWWGLGRLLSSSYDATQRQGVWTAAERRDFGSDSFQWYCGRSTHRAGAAMSVVSSVPSTLNSWGGVLLAPGESLARFLLVKWRWHLWVSLPLLRASFWSCYHAT
jgi:hypothetical protein